jgi:hypothetical protein
MVQFFTHSRLIVELHTMFFPYIGSGLLSTSWDWKFEYPGPVVSLRLVVGYVKSDFKDVPICPTAVEAILEFFPNLSELRNLRRFYISALTLFPDMTWTTLEKGEVDLHLQMGYRPLPSKLAHAFTLVASQVMKGGPQDSMLGRGINELAAKGTIDRHNQESHWSIFSA